MRVCVVVSFVVVALALPAHAGLVGVFGPDSSAGVAPSIIPAPTDVLDDIVTNQAQQGFNEAQGVTTTVVHATDQGPLPIGVVVDSHMIFLNSVGSSGLSHPNVLWVFDGALVGVMSDVGGTMEAASTFEFGAPGTNYTITGPGTGPAAPFSARGMEGADSYMAVNPWTLRVNMGVSEPGDWIRVLTNPNRPNPIPEPGTLGLLASGLLALGVLRRRRKHAA